MHSRRTRLFATLSFAALLLAVTSSAAQVVRWRQDEVVKCHLESGDPYNQVFVRIELDGRIDRPVEVRYETVAGTATPGSDYSPLSGRLMFLPSSLDFDDRLVAFDVFDDAQAEFNETIELRMTVGAGASLAGPSSAFVVILDDETLADETYQDCRQGIILGKTDNDHSWANDPIVPYDLTITNTGPLATNYRLREIVPVNTQFRPDLSSSGWQCTPGNGERSVCERALPPLERGGITNARFTVEVLAGTPEGYEIFNALDVVSTA